ncbi:MAG: virulence protein [Christensenellaceae bacterium]|jgi:hypothetical protein|nr:virulence protein [Christensenellaceae bacterium]
MEVRFEKTGAERKALVTAISEITGTKAKYMGAPGFAYCVGGHIVTVDGMLVADDAQAQEVSSLLDALAERGVFPVEMPDLNGTAAYESVTPLAVASAPGEKETATAVGVLLEGAFAIELPAEAMDVLASENLEKLVAGKAPLIRAALGENLADGADALPIVIEGGRVSFPWFRLGIDADAIAAWSFFAAALRDTAIKQKRVVMSDKPYDGSEKYAMRCFLLKNSSQLRKRFCAFPLDGDMSDKTPVYLDFLPPLAA